MAKVRLSAGQELDVLNSDELKTTLEETLSGYLRQPRRVRIEQAFALDGSGDGSLVVYQALAGMQFLLNRLIVILAGYTYESPYSATSGGVNVYRGTVAGDLVDGYSFGSGAGSLPATMTYSDSQAIEVSDGEILTVQVLAAAASGSIIVHGHGLEYGPPPGEASFVSSAAP